jgi:glutaredoxin
MSNSCESIIIVYGISDCPACLRACAASMDRYPRYEYVFVNTDFSKSFREILKKKYDHHTFPIIVLEQNDSETMIGGYNELLKFFEVNTKYSENSAPIQEKNKEPD